MPQFLTPDGSIPILTWGFEDSEGPEQLFYNEFEFDWEEEQYRMHLNSYLQDDGPEFTDDEYLKKIHQYLRSVEKEAKRILGEYGVSDEDIALPPVPIKLRKDFSIPVGVYCAARVIELAKSLKSLLNSNLSAKSAHKMGMIVELVKGVDRELIEMDLVDNAQNIDVGRRVTQGGKKGRNENTRKHAPNKELIKNVYRKMAKLIWKKNPDLSCRDVAPFARRKTIAYLENNGKTDLAKDVPGKQQIRKNICDLKPK